MKTITLRFFDVEYTAGLTSTDTLVSRVLTKLSSKASQRLMDINKQESNKQDLISDFLNVNNGQMVAGTSIRITKSKDVPIITDDMLKQNQFKVSSINKNAKDDEKTCLDYFYFCLSNNKLIVTLEQRSGISRFETYLNWLLSTKDTGEIINITPTVNADEISVSDLKRITIGNSYNISVDNPGGDNKESIGSKMVTLSNDILKKLFSDTASFSDLMGAKICSADLVIKFSKPRGMGEEEYKKKTAGAILKPLEDYDNVRFKTNGGKKLLGSQVLKIEQVEVEEVDGAVNEQEVYHKIIKAMK